MTIRPNIHSVYRLTVTAIAICLVGIPTVFAGPQNNDPIGTHSIVLPGNQQDPDVYGRYIVFIDSAQAGAKLGSVKVYDSGPTTDPADDNGVIVLDAALDNSEPAISGRFIAWRKGCCELKVYDMGEDMILPHPPIQENQYASWVNRIDALGHVKIFPNCGS